MTGKDVAKKIFEDTGFTLLYLTVALLCAGIIVGLLIYFLKREKFDAFKKSVLGVAFGYAIAVVVLMTYLKFQYNAYDTDLQHNLVDAYLVTPIMSMLLIALIGGLIIYVSMLFNKKVAKAFGLVTMLGELAAFITTMVFIMRYFKETDSAEYYPSLNNIGLIVSAVIIIVILIVGFILGKKHKDENNTKALVFGAISIALAFALSYIRMFKLPQGGSVTLASLLPLMVYCCMFGTRRGIIVCLIYGVLQAIQDPWIIHPVQFLLDYPLAFGLVGLSGIFMEYGVLKKHKVVAFVLGAVLAGLLRYASHVCSGIFAFADYADLENYSTAITYSFAYNSFTFADMAIALAAGCFLFASKAFNSQMLGATAKIAVSDVDDSVEDDINDADECNYKIYSDIPEENLQNEEINKSENDNL